MEANFNQQEISSPLINQNLLAVLGKECNGSAYAASCNMTCSLHQGRLDVQYQHSALTALCSLCSSAW